MKKVFQKWIIPSCLLIIICTQLLTYYLKSEIQTGLLVVVFALMPSSIKGLGFNISDKSFKLLERIMIFLAVVFLLYTFWFTLY